MGVENLQKNLGVRDKNTFGGRYGCRGRKGIDSQRPSRENP
jgi:hypothetical protein